MATGEACLGAGITGEVRGLLWESIMGWRECLHGAAQIAWFLICDMSLEGLASTLHSSCAEKVRVRVVHGVEARR